MTCAKDGKSKRFAAEFPVNGTGNSVQKSKCNREEGQRLEMRLFGYAALVTEKLGALRTMAIVPHLARELAPNLFRFFRKSLFRLAERAVLVLLFEDDVARGTGRRH